MHIPRCFASIDFRRAAPALAAILVTGAESCRDSFREVGSSPATAQIHADQLFESFATRFNQVEVTPQYDAARTKLAQSALVPSRIFKDDASWTARPSPSTHVLYVSGTLVDGRYHLETRPSLTPAAHPGDTRHSISLEQLDGSSYRWDTSVDMSIGTISAGEVSVLLTSLLAAPEGRTEREVRDDYRSAFPRATAAFGKGFSVDSLHVTPGALGTTAVTVTVGFHPELMKPGYPGLAGYMDKYLGPAKYHFVLADRAGVALFDAEGHDRAVTLHYRVQQGKLTSLFGPPRPWADSLVLTSDLSLKVKIFNVGFHSLLTDFILSDTEHERAWTITARREPKWELPFVTERLIRSPLRKPFDGQGTLFRLSVHDSAGTESVFTRRTRMDVQESPIMRFIGSLGSHAMGDLDHAVEVDEDRFWHDGFIALQGDLEALAPQWTK